MTETLNLNHNGKKKTYDKGVNTSQTLHMSVTNALGACSIYLPCFILFMVLNSEAFFIERFYSDSAH